MKSEEESYNASRCMAQFAMFVVLALFLGVPLGSAQEERSEQALRDLQAKYESALSEIQRLRTKLEEAEKEISRLEKEGSASKAAQGKVSLSEKRYQEAIARLTAAIKEKPEEAALYERRAMAYRSLGDHQAALRDFVKAIELRPEGATAYNERGILYYLLGKPESAIADFDKAIALNPKLAEAYNNRAVMHRLQGDYGKAIEDFRMASTLGVKPADQSLKISVAEVKTAQRELAKAGFEPGPPDGVPGRQTVEALRQFQRSRDLAITARLDQRTRTALGMNVSNSTQSAANLVPPEFLDRPTPQYPAVAAERGLEGTVGLQAELLTDGTVGKVEVVESSGHQVLDKAALDAAKKWRHKPATLKGEPVKVWVTFDMNFALNKKKASMSTGNASTENSD